MSDIKLGHGVWRFGALEVKRLEVKRLELLKVGRLSSLDPLVHPLVLPLVELPAMLCCEMLFCKVLCREMSKLPVPLQKDIII